MSENSKPDPFKSGKVYAVSIKVSAIVRVRAPSAASAEETVRKALSGAVSNRVDDPYSYYTCLEDESDLKLIQEVVSGNVEVIGSSPYGPYAKPPANEVVYVSDGERLVGQVGIRKNDGSLDPSVKR
jgi:hypothetical protein